MVQSEVIKKLKSIAAEILPENSTLYLYGSRARGTARPDSDWDLLLLLDSETVTSDDYDMTYPFYDFGLDIGQYVSTHIYTKKQWRSWTFLPYYKNVEHDKIVLK
ncbi:MAG: nucleotidyltransferase domain-containing protein [Bacteroidales bacterium]|jgi:predicted nucleotidyltransferase|nr:nucleotidyltransferase domain-containing protein [Bacteroidales bacterium]MBQ5540837.1 nucleotidyltransferase domain-containing protein [Bacteroidales bacterium]MBQ9213385.1 nucleotidyltransferase domain-containing protein [Bacteroidales bacterium]MEE3447144.1 nucleotidyltransferase domain-containing protein [Bacteroidales bacterium]